MKQINVFTHEISIIVFRSVDSLTAVNSSSTEFSLTNILDYIVERLRFVQSLGSDERIQMFVKFI